MNCKKCGAKLRKGTKFCVECGSTVVRQSKSKRIIAILLALLVLLGIGAGLVFSGGVIPVFVAGNNEGFSEEVFEEIANSNYIEIASDDSTNSTGSGEILIRGSMEETIWGIKYENGLSEQHVEDAITARNALEEDIQLDFEFDNDSAIISIHEDNIESGMPYTITIGEGIYFTEEKLVNARAITFIPKREDVEKIEYKENVYQLETDEVIIQNNNTIQLTSDRDAQVGDIIVIPVENEYRIMQEQALRVDEVLSDGSIKTGEPTLEEVFEQLEISGTYSMNPDDFILDEEAIEKQVRESSFFDYLVNTAYADSIDDNKYKIEVKMLPKKNKKLNVRVTVTFFDAFNSDNDFKVDLDLSFKADVHVNVVRFLVFDVSCDSLSTVKISASLTDDDDVSLGDVTEKLMTKEEIEELAEEIRREGNSILKLGKIPIPLPGPVSGFFEMEAFLDHSIFIEGQAAGGVTIASNAGALISPISFKPYQTKMLSAGLDKGIGTIKLETKAGLKVKLGITLWNIVNAGFEAEGGVYATIGGSLVNDGELLENIKDSLYGFVEMGVYYELSLFAEYNGLFNKKEFEWVLAGDKYPLLEWGKPDMIIEFIIDQKSISINENGTCQLPQIELLCYNIPSDEYYEKEAEFRQLTYTLPEGMEYSVDNTGNITFSGDIPDEFQIVIGHKDTREQYNLNCQYSAFVFEGVIGNTSGNLANGGIAAESDGWIYYRGDSGFLFRMKIDGSDKTRLNNHDTRSINVIEETVYYVNREDNHIYAIHVDGSNNRRLSDDNTSKIYVVNGWIYYSGCRINLDGTNKEIICDEHILATDGSIVVYETNTVNDFIQYELWVKDIESGSIQQVLGGSFADEFSDGNGFGVVQIIGDVLYFQIYDHGVPAAGLIYSYDLKTKQTRKIGYDRFHQNFNVTAEYIYDCYDEYETSRCLLTRESELTREQLDIDVVNRNETSLYNVCLAGDWVFYMCGNETRVLKEGEIWGGSAQQGTYLIHGSGSRYITEADLEGFDAWTARLARNEIFARYGYVFKIPEIQVHFENMSWYTANPNVNGDNPPQLNEFEEYNVGVIKEYEEKLLAGSSTFAFDDLYIDSKLPYISFVEWDYEEWDYIFKEINETEGGYLVECDLIIVHNPEDEGGDTVEIVESRTMFVSSYAPTHCLDGNWGESSADWYDHYTFEEFLEKGSDYGIWPDFFAVIEGDEIIEMIEVYTP